MNRVRQRSVMAVGPGDYIKLQGGVWVKIITNTAFGAFRTPKAWAILAEDGKTYTMFDIYAYAKAEDLE